MEQLIAVTWIWNIGIGGAVVMGMLVLAWTQQRFLIYVPDRTRVAPIQAGLPPDTEITLQAPDGVRLVAWYQPARPGEPTLLYLHGNAGNLLSRAGRMAEYLKQDRGFYMLSYRGYGGSGGRPSERANVADAILAYEDLRRRGVAAGDIILYGESLGSGVAVQLATQRPVGGVILDAPYTSLADVGERIYPYLPVRTFIIDRYDSLSRISAINAPLLIVNGELDGLIPVDMGEALLARAQAPKRMFRVEGAGHSDHYLFGSYDMIQAWIDQEWKTLKLQQARQH